MRAFPTTLLTFVLVFFSSELSCNAEYIASNDPASSIDLQLKGRWSPNCEVLDGILIDEKMKAVITINSNQIVIASHLQSSLRNPRMIDVYFDRLLDAGRGAMRIKWDDFSRTEKIGTIYLNSTSGFRFHWLGFYSGRTRSRFWVQEPDFYRDGEPNIFRKCES